MDGVSRFDNPKPLLNGGFIKPPSIPSDAASAKPLIIERYKAMLRERQEELRVSGYDGVLNIDEVVRIYEVLLSELTFNSKPIITDLTIIAGEQRAHGEGIADLICARIIEVPVEQKLPSLYLLDSIVKNIGREYVRYFSARLPEVFCEAYSQVHPNMHPAMRHLFGTWSAVFPSSVLHKIEAQLEFSPSGNRQSSALTPLRSESPQSAHGIHVNPKYLEARHQFGPLTADNLGADGSSSSGLSGRNPAKQLPFPTSRVTRPSPYGVGPTKPLSPSLDEFGVDNSPRRVAERTSPSKPVFEYGLGRFNQSVKNPNTYTSNSGVDLRGPRALIDAYGIDERERKPNLKRQGVENLDVDGLDRKRPIKSWQNTEEEEFDWQDMNPSLGDVSRRELYSLSATLSARSNLPPHRVPSPADYRSNYSRAHLISASDSSVNEDIPEISSHHGVIGKVNGLSNTTSQATTPDQESWKLPQHLNPRGGISYSGKGSFPALGELRPAATFNFTTPDEQPFRPQNDMGSRFDSLASEIRPAEDPALAKSWAPANLQSSHPPPLSTFPPQMQVRGQAGMMNAGNTTFDQGPNRPAHPSAAHSSLVQFPSQHPGPFPSTQAHDISVQPHLISQGVRQNMLPLHSSSPSLISVGPPNHGYAANMRGPPHRPVLSNFVQGHQLPMPILNPPNAPLHLSRPPFQSFPQVLPPIIPQRPPVSQNLGQVAPNLQPGGSSLSGLLSSLVAQGLISSAKQDSIGVEFDPELLKVRHESAITALYADLPRQCTTCGHRFKSQEEHSKHMDWHVNRNRTLKNRKTKPSPKWFVSTTMWLHGAEAMGNEAVPGFLPTEDVVEQKDDEEMAVPADENQTACALCGEPFDDFYSDEMDEWMYKGAVYMNAPVGSTVGADRSSLGPIVHAKCRSDSHGIPTEDFGKDKLE